MAGEVLAVKIKVLAEDDKPIPEPSPFESNMTDSGSRAVAVILVPVTSPAPKNMSVNITLPDDVLAAIDRFAEYSGLSRSGFIENAAKKAMTELNGREIEGRNLSVREARPHVDRAPSFDRAPRERDAVDHRDTIRGWIARHQQQRVIAARSVSGDRA